MEITRYGRLPEDAITTVIAQRGEITGALTRTVKLIPIPLQRSGSLHFCFVT